MRPFIRSRSFARSITKAVLIVHAMLSRHRRTTLLTLAAAFDALVHIADAFTTVRTGFANFCARFAVVLVEFAVAAHESNTGIARGDAVQHQLDVTLSQMIAAFSQAGCCQHVTDHRLTFLTAVDAVLFREVRGRHEIVLCIGA